MLLQLPIPQINFGKTTANVPLAAACLKQSAAGFPGATIDILPQSLASYLGDAALTDYLLSAQPDVVGFSVYSWNLHRSIHLAKIIKEISRSKIIFGGPEIAPESHVFHNDFIDFFVMGEGESSFHRILKNIMGTSGSLPVAERGHLFEAGCRIVTGGADKKYRLRSSPYVNHLLEPHVDNLMYLETQRGCAYKCGFCYYNKSRRTVYAADDKIILEAIGWATDNGVKEICIIDPSFNSRRGLQNLLKKIAEVNRNRKLFFNAEIRAESVDQKTADLFASAGFTSFEIGLQSTSPEALRVMNRHTDLKRFIKGTSFLKERGIIPKVDLIVGLPGDDLNGFKKSLMFIAENNLADDIQIFPLSVLPGTTFRLKSRELGLFFEDYPPYFIKQTPTYPLEDIYLSFDYAESLFDVSLFPAPHLDIAFKINSTPVAESGDILVSLQNRPFIKTLILNSKRPHREIEAASAQMTSPYQIVISRPLKDSEYICKTLAILTEANPFTPLEIIFLAPDFLPDTQLLLSSIKLFRPGYLDIYNNYQYNTPGNRSVLFTLVSDRVDISFEGEMKRQVFWWKKSSLPDAEDIDALSGFDGILIDTAHSFNHITSWQDRMAPHADDLPYISFAEIGTQKRWLGLTAADEFSGLFL